MLRFCDGLVAVQHALSDRDFFVAIGTRDQNY